MSWVFPSFDDFHERPKQTKQRLPPKRKESVPDDIKDQSQMIWCDEYEPHNKEDLAVNPKKVEEVEFWLSSAFSGRLGRAPIALLNGPSGSGKTTTLKALSKYMSFTIKEWITPPKPVSFRENYEGVVEMFYESQVKQFEEFLFKASRYSSVVLPLDLDKCIVLVEDIPSIYFNDTAAFETTLQKFSGYGLCPLVFICSTGSSEFSLERMIFKEKLLSDLKFSKISFNPVGKRLLNSALKRIIQEGKKKNLKVFQKVPEELIDQAIEMSNSDIRSAVNQFQYVISGRLVMRKKTETSKLHSDPVEGRDQFHDVFRCLGRVLYCKKVNVTDEKTGVVKQRLFYDPDEIVGSVSSIPNLFLSLLNENYVSIFSDMKKIAEATEYITHSNILMSKWRERDTEVNYSLYLSVLGLMNCSNVNIKKTWFPMKKSKMKEAIDSYDEKMEKCKYFFPEKLGDRKTLLTEFLPYYAKMDLSRMQEDKKKFIMSFSEGTSSGRTSVATSVGDKAQHDHTFLKPISSGSSGTTSLATNEGDKAQHLNACSEIFLSGSQAVSEEQLLAEADETIIEEFDSD